MHIALLNLRPNNRSLGWAVRLVATSPNHGVIVTMPVFSKVEQRKPILTPIFRFLTSVKSFPVTKQSFFFHHSFSHAWHWQHVFPRLTLVTRFPALHTGHTFSRPSHRLQVFPRLALAACFYEVTRFPALGTDYLISRDWYYAWHQATGYLFSRASLEIKRTQNLLFLNFIRTTLL